MTRRILLLDPPGHLRWLNLGLGYLAGVATHCGAEVKVLDFNNLRGLNEHERIESAFGGHEPSVIGASLFTATVRAGVSLLARAKAIHPNSIFIVGGPHISLSQNAIMDEFNFVDLAVVGEGEYTLQEICKWLDGRKKLEEIPGLIYRTKRGIRHVPPRPFSRELDKLPFPDFCCFDSVQRWGRLTVYPMITSRGCPYSCSFCSAHLSMGKKWRYRSPENVITELKMAKQRYETEEIHFYDDNFSFDVRHARKVCSLMIEEKLGLRWWLRNGVRADKIDRDTAGLMKQAGCYAVDVGVESGDPFVFSKINKGESLEEIKCAVKLLKETGVKRVGGFFILGLPYSTLDSDIKSIKFRHDLGLDEATWSFFIPYPGTKAADYIARHGRIFDLDSAHQFDVEPGCETEEYSRRERVIAMMMARYLEFHPGLPFLLRLLTLEVLLVLRGKSLRFLMEYNLLLLKKTVFNRVLRLFIKTARRLGVSSLRTKMPPALQAPIRTLAIWLDERMN